MIFARMLSAHQRSQLRLQLGGGQMLDLLRRFWSDDEELTEVEYALLLTLIAVVGVTAWTRLDKQPGR